MSRPGGSNRGARLAELVLVAMAGEFLWLWSRRGFAAPAAVAPAAAVAPGACLALAARLAAGRAPWPLIGAAFAAAFPAHLLDLRRRPLR